MLSRWYIVKEKKIEINKCDNLSDYDDDVAIGAYITDISILLILFDLPYDEICLWNNIKTTCPNWKFFNYFKNSLLPSIFMKQQYYFVIN